MLVYGIDSTRLGLIVARDMSWCKSWMCHMGRRLLASILCVPGLVVSAFTWNMPYRPTSPMASRFIFAPMRRVYGTRKTKCFSQGWRSIQAGLSNELRRNSGLKLQTLVPLWAPYHVFGAASFCLILFKFVFKHAINFAQRGDWTFYRRHLGGL